MEYGYCPCIIHSPVYGEGKTRGRTRCEGGGKSEGEALKRMIDETFTASKNAIVTRFPVIQKEGEDSCGRIASLETDVGQGFEKGGREEARKVGPPWTGMEFKWRSSHETGGKIKKFDLILHWTSQ